MAPLDIDWIATAALAAGLGWAGSKSLRAAVGLCVLVALLGWAASYPLMLLSPRFGEDTALAEDYINGFSARSAAIEMVAAFGWTFVWFGSARVARLVIRRRRKAVS